MRKAQDLTSMLTREQHMCQHARGSAGTACVETDVETVVSFLPAFQLVRCHMASCLVGRAKTEVQLRAVSIFQIKANTRQPSVIAHLGERVLSLYTV